MNERKSPPNPVNWVFWMVGVLSLLYNLAGVVNFVMQMNPDSVATLPQMYRQLVENRPLWATVGFAIAVFGGVLGCVLLLLRKSTSYYVFLLSLLGALVTLVHSLLQMEGAVSVDFLIGNGLQVGVTVFLIWYSRRAHVKGWIG